MCFSRTCPQHRSEIAVNDQRMIEWVNLTKRFGQFTAVDHVSFSVAKRTTSVSSGPTARARIHRYPQCYLPSGCSALAAQLAPSASLIFLLRLIGLRCFSFSVQKCKSERTCLTN